MVHVTILYVIRTTLDCAVPDVIKTNYIRGVAAYLRVTIHLNIWNLSLVTTPVNEQGARD